MRNSNILLITMSHHFPEVHSYKKHSSYITTKMRILLIKNFMIHAKYLIPHQADCTSKKNQDETKTILSSGINNLTNIHMLFLEMWFISITLKFF